MALAQESFSMPADVAEEGDALDAQRPSRPGRGRRGADAASAAALPQRGRQSEEGQLARMVRELRELEDDIVAKMTATERLLAQLESRRIHEDAGYASPAELVVRMLAGTPVLRAMREAVPPPAPPGAKLTVAKRDPTDARSRQTKALTAIARALDRLRGLDGEIYQCANAARTRLGAIEAMRIFEECGYASFEEFLERALGPSPVLASVMALVAEGSGAEQPGRPQAGADASVKADGADDFSQKSFDDSGDSVFEEPSSSAQSLDSGGAPETIAKGSEGGEAKGALDASATSVSARPARRRLAGIVVSVVLCAAATVAGAAAGVWTGSVTGGHGPAEPSADASVARQRSAAEPSGDGLSSGTPQSQRAPKQAPVER